MKWIRIGDVVEVKPGFQVRDRSELSRDGNISFVQVKDIDRSKEKILLDNLEKVKMEKDMSKYQIHKGDVLFLSKGNFIAGLIDEATFDKNAIYVPMHHFYTLKIISNEITPKFLCWLLNNKSIRDKIVASSKGEIMASINRNDLESIEIPLPSLERQQFIVELVELRKREKEIVSNIEAQKDKIYERALQFATLESSNFMDELRKI